MAYHDPFLLGPLGRMLALPSPPGTGLGAAYERISGEHRSLRGGTTIDVLGAVRSWSFPFEWRRDDEAARLITRWTSPITSEQLRLLDPLAPNRLSLNVASSGGVFGVPSDLLVSTAPGPTVITPATRPALLDGLVDRAIRWQPPATVTELYAGHPTRVPVTGGEALTFRCWVRGTAGVGVIPFVREFDAAGANVNTTAATVTLADAWQEVAVPAVMDPGRVSALVGLHVDAGAAGRVIDVMGLQFGPDAELPAGQWQPGGGAPAVIVTKFDHSYGRLGRRAMTLDLREVI